MRAYAAGLTSALVAMLTLTAVPAVAAPTAGPDDSAAATDTTAAAPLDPQDQASVAAAFRTVYEPNAAVMTPPVASDAVSSCRAGTAPSQLQDATLEVVNYFRAMSGVAPVTFDPALSAAAQRAALMMYANNELRQNPPSNWRCYTEDGADAAIRSSLGRSVNGADVVRSYMDEAGTANIAASRRWSLQRPEAQVMGNGTVGWANALLTDGYRGLTQGPAYTSWPSAGYFPTALEPNGRWSFTAWDPDQSLAAATVQVTGPDGLPVAVTAAPVNAAWGSLVFDVGSLAKPSGSQVHTYTVTVDGITARGEPVSPSTYSVALFDPSTPVAEPLKATNAPAVSGTAEVGSVLTASAPSWSSPEATTAYQWLRAGTAIPGAARSTYTVTPADVGMKLGVRAHGTAPAHAPGISVSNETGPVAKVTATLGLTGSSPDQGTARVGVTVTAPGHPGLGGTVDVREGTKIIAAALPVLNGVTTFNTTGATAGAHTYSFLYGGTESVTAATATATVGVLDRTSPVVTAAGTSSAVGKLSLAIGVSAPGEPALAGTVTIKEGSTTVKSAIPVTAGKASWSASGLKSGQHTYAVTYSGTGRVKATTKTVVATVKAKVNPTVTLSGSSSGKGKIKVSVTVKASGQSNLGGKVTIKEGTKTLKSAITVTKGLASWSASSVKSGKHTYTVSYTGTSEVNTGSAKITTTVR